MHSESMNSTNSQGLPCTTDGSSATNSRIYLWASSVSFWMSASETMTIR